MLDKTPAIASSFSAARSAPVQLAQIKIEYSGVEIESKDFVDSEGAWPRHVCSSKDLISFIKNKPEGKKGKKSIIDTVREELKSGEKVEMKVTYGESVTLKNVEPNNHKLAKSLKLIIDAEKRKMEKKYPEKLNCLSLATISFEKVGNILKVKITDTEHE